MFNDSPDDLLGKTEVLPIEKFVPLISVFGAFALLLFPEAENAIFENLRAVNVPCVEELHGYPAIVTAR
ncbi:MAG: hypothetical protein BWY82_01400 [Verrucomicrobia bacterium ADurb.Bin474]|nr:MAG: hypothetical protein BWY82_01400 [Verrucomicrobia bacterium ADurb.Bin474]